MGTKAMSKVVGGGSVSLKYVNGKTTVRNIKYVLQIPYFGYSLLSAMKLGQSVCQLRSRV